MKILVTGGSGFLGSHIADAASNAGHQVVLFDVASSPYLRPDQTMVVGDILDANVVKQAAAGCQAIFHLAAIADINTTIAQPRDAVQVNILGTLNVIEAALKLDLHRLVFSSSIYVYSNHGSFYRTTKQACELLIQDYQERYGLPYTILRFGSLYGPRAGRTNAVHRMLIQALSESRIEYPGSGNEIREYIHVFDGAAMSIETLDPSYQNQIVHLTGRERMTTRDMLDLIKEMMGGRIEVEVSGATFEGHYVQTPYSYVPKLGRRMTRNSYIDLGLGLLDYLQSLDRERDV